MLYCTMRRRTQLYLDEEQYRWLKRQAGKGSIAGVVRTLIDRARARPTDETADPLIKYLLEEVPSAGSRKSSVSTLDEDVYGR
jgi:hypothetical protein